MDANSQFTELTLVKEMAPLSALGMTKTAL
jgi:hypothetical protein